MISESSLPSFGHPIGSKFRRHQWVAILGGMVLNTVMADWPMIRQGADHSGFVDDAVTPPYHLVWARQIEHERLGTAMEPILSEGRLFLSTHQASVYALDAVTGESLWSFQAHGPFLHSPLAVDGKVVAACSDGHLYALDAQTGRLEWTFASQTGGFSAAPVAASGNLYIGSRAGELLAIRLQDGHLVWRHNLGLPIRQTAAITENQVFLTAEDLRVRCFDAASGRLLWTSEPLPGQTARDYYPITVRQNGRTRVIVRTNPLLNMAQRIGRDRTFLCQQAGIDDRSWQTLDRWIKSAQARGHGSLWTNEQKAILNYLSTNRDARSFFVLDGQTGQEAITPPILWIGGCQAVGAQPALTAKGQLVVFYRSAYGNWNHGVAPLVSLGLLDLEQNQISPLFHQQGRQPAWNCFWGTADESQNFLVAGNTVIIIHQGTLSGFHLQKQELFPIWGERDTFGGFRNPPWARNEWHGPGRSGVALEQGRIYWQTGSRLLCLAPGIAVPSESSVQPLALSTNIPRYMAPILKNPAHSQYRQCLSNAIEEILSASWAPLWVEPGLAGRDFSFDHSGEFLEAMAWAYPHLDASLQARVKSRLREEWHRYPPFTRQGWYPLETGVGREWFSVPAHYRSRHGTDTLPHPFGNMSSIWLYARRCGEESLVLEQWPKLKSVYNEFKETGWKIGSQGALFANRYLASLRAFHQMAMHRGETDLAVQVDTQTETCAAELVAWWQRAAGRETLKSFNSSAELDPFIGKGDSLSLAVAPHRHKLALFLDLSPEIAHLLRSKAPQAVDQVWQQFQSLYPTWALQGEERQVHFGENFVDPPGLAMGAFRALAWLRPAGAPPLERCLDLPFCRADLYYLTKLALILERPGKP